LRERHDTLHTVSSELPKRIGEAISGYKDLLTHQMEISASDSESYTSREAPLDEELHRTCEKDAANAVIDLLEKGSSEIQAIQIEEDTDIGEGEIDKVTLPGLEDEKDILTENDEDGTRITQCKETLNSLEESDKQKLRYHYLRTKLDKENELFDRVTVDEELVEIGKFKIPEALKRFNLDAVETSLQNILSITGKPSPYPSYSPLKEQEVPENVIWTKKHEPRIVFRYV
jgi:hypothetical protein